MLLESSERGVRKYSKMSTLVLPQRFVGDTSTMSGEMSPASAPATPKAKPARPERKAEKAPASKPQRTVRTRQPIETAEEPVVRAPPAIDPGAAIAIGVIGGALIGGAFDHGPRVNRPPRPYPYPEGGMGPGRPPRPYPDGGIGRGVLQPNRDVIGRPLGSGTWQQPAYGPR